MKNNIICVLVLAMFIVFAGCKSKRSTSDNAKEKREKREKREERWTGSWAAAQMLVEPKNMPPAPGLAGNTFRQIIKVSLGGNSLRMRFSNLFGSETMVLKSVNIAPVLQAPAIQEERLKVMSFNGSASITLEAGKEVFSDALDFDLQPGALLAVTIHYGKVSSRVTGHPGSRTTSYLLEGDQSGNAAFSDAVRTDHWYTIMGLDIQAWREQANVVCLGNSIIDGRGSGTNKQNRWTDILAARLRADGKTSHVGVLNLGIGGNCVVRGGLGPTALERFDRDVLSQSGTKWLIILEGINDIGGIRKEEDATRKADEIIEGYKIMIQKAHARGLKVYGGTILPFEKSFYDAPYRQLARNIVNAWIRNSGSFDAVIDFDKEMSSGSESGVILSEMHNGDFLHPNENGYLRMGELVNLDLFR